MFLIAAAVVLGLLVGRILPRVSGHRAAVRLRWWPLLGVGVTGQIAAAQLTGEAAIAVALFGLGALLVLALRNVAIAGTGVLAVGLFCNFLGIAINGGMPVRPSALVQVGAVDQRELDDDTIALEGPRRLEDGRDPLVVLGDIIPVEPTGQVVSFGDLIVAMGAACIVTDVTRRRRRPIRQPAPRPARAAAAAGPVGSDPTPVLPSA